MQCPGGTQSRPTSEPTGSDGSIRSSLHLLLDEIERDINELRLARWDVEYPVGHADRELRRPRGFQTKA